MSRVLALDYGSRRVGVALSDPTRILATGLPTLERGQRGLESLVEAVSRLVREHEAAEIVLGHPLDMDGSRGEPAREVERLADLLRERLGIPVSLHDERLTTVRAYRVLREGGTREREARPRADRLAAVLILQNYLDSHPGGSGA